ncbi:MAG: hypothetical protein GX238_01250 [Epulopiscium sp.]|nr:hypothetical protein [Candidatus Epulonipiscium sp.]
MEIVFDAKTYGEYIMEEEQIEAFTQAIYSIYNTLKESLDLSLLNSIIIPEDYKEGLFDFQRLNGHTEFITENEYGRGMAQVVSSENGETVYNIIIDKNIIFTLVGDDHLQAIKDNLNSEEEYALFLSSRQLAIYTLYHEFGHVHEYGLNRGIKWIQNKEVKTDLRSQYILLAMQCWSEYFACRTSSSAFPFDESDALEIITTCNNAEKGLQKQRSMYNRGIINLDNFVLEFHNYTGFILKKIASAHGNLYCLGDYREKMINVIEENLEESYVKTIWKNYGKTLDELYILYPNWEDDNVFNGLCELIVEYYKQYEIYISETPQGIYYDIPVRL